MPQGIYIRTKKWLKIRSLAQKKLWKNIKYRKHMVAKHKGKRPWMLGRKHSPKTILKLKLSHLGKPLSKKHRRNVVKALKTFKSRLKGKKSPFWKGKNSYPNILRRRKKFRDWRLNVFTRDNFTCVLCRKKGGKLNAHHIKSFTKFPRLRYKINNGLTVHQGEHKKWLIDLWICSKDGKMFMDLINSV